MIIICAVSGCASAGPSKCRSMWTALTKYSNVGEPDTILCDSIVDEAAQALQADRNEETRAAFQVAFTAPAVVDEVFRLTRQCDQEVAAMMADNDQHALIAGTEAARMFLVGWEGLGRFGRGLGGATDASLWQIREGDLVEIGRHIAELLEPRPDVLGNSGSASSGSAAQPSSTTPATTPQTAPSADGTAGS